MVRMKMKKKRDSSVIFWGKRADDLVWYGRKLRESGIRPCFLGKIGRMISYGTDENEEKVGFVRLFPEYLDI